LSLNRLNGRYLAAVEKSKINSELKFSSKEGVVQEPQVQTNIDR
jgi:hypothetical protein